MALSTNGQLHIRELTVSQPAKTVSARAVDTNLAEPEAAQRERHPRHHAHHNSTSTSTSLVSQPVLVRTYSGHSSRPGSQPRSPARPQFDHDKNEGAKLPPLKQFEFDQILAAVHDEVEQSLEAIAAIWASHKMSLASEYTAHLPPQGDVGRLGQTLHSARPGSGPDTTLTAVSEASSSTERLAALSHCAVQQSGGADSVKKQRTGKEHEIGPKAPTGCNNLIAAVHDKAMRLNGSRPDHVVDYSSENQGVRSLCKTAPLQTVSPARTVSANKGASSRGPGEVSGAMRFLALGSKQLALPSSSSPSSGRNPSGSSERRLNARLPRSAGVPAKVSLTTVDRFVSPSLPLHSICKTGDRDSPLLPIIKETTQSPTGHCVSESSRTFEVIATGNLSSSSAPLRKTHRRHPFALESMASWLHPCTGQSLSDSSRPLPLPGPAVEHSLRQLLSTASPKTSQH